ncbi:hypothetical protein L6164_029078 [Bauhinia variegata]|uniref:Uncharacterized protein n=1 Tax=Bauhinia variegata TaxID=167791 RepID=A0ACB9L8A9_BAUVA|nr:hypothetical protein L6164_029078 [Bauhinia variegata]
MIVNMANTVITLLSLVVCFVAAEGRKTLKSKISAKDEGLCKSLIASQGYKCEEHKVTTTDGYILSLQRMPQGRSGRKADKPPVLLQHGILTDAVPWIFNSPDQSLAFILADNGFDVWLANARGTKYSRGHTSLNPNTPNYWDWSFDELAANDLPASIEYVFKNTGQKLHYVGHSLGTLSVLAPLSQGKLVNWLRSAALLCPIAHLNQIPSKAMALAANFFLADVVYWLGIREFIHNGQYATKLLARICSFPGMNCTDVMPLFTGNNCCINSSKIVQYLDNEPQSTSTRNLIHLSQLTRSGKVSMYDYGNPLENMAHYGNISPPLYDMKSIPKDFPLFLAHGGEDILSDVKDMNVLLEELKDHNWSKLTVLFRKEYAHNDFIFGVNAKQVVYDPMMAFLTLNSS